MASAQASTRSWIESLGASQRERLKTELTEEEKAVLAFAWNRWARPTQLQPEGDWDGWLILAGRGWGKTRTGAETVREWVESGRCKRIGLVGETSADGRDVLVEGESGILAISPPWNRPIFTAAAGRPKLTWPNGAIATLYDAREPDQLRGPQHDGLLFDEFRTYGKAGHGEPFQKLAARVCRAHGFDPKVFR